MNVSIIGGTGYVGLITGVGLASCGHDVICADIDEKKIINLNKGIPPMYEEGLSDMLEHTVKNGKIVFTTDTGYAARRSDIIIIAVGTPESKHGDTDMKQVYQSLTAVTEAMYMDDAGSYKVIVMKSTVPVGTCESLETRMRRVLKNKDGAAGFDVVSNPEFLREGSAMQDFMNPERIVIGTESSKALSLMKDLYASFDVPFVITDRRSSEMIKYACNSYLAARISFINEIAEICECVNADVKSVINGMKFDSRIGRMYLNPGPGFGGPCLSKDIKSLIDIGKKNNANVALLKSVVSRNQRQIKKIMKYICSEHDKLAGKRVAILGLSFKAGTDDTRNSPSLQLIKKLAVHKCTIAVYDPAVRRQTDPDGPGVSKLPVRHCGSPLDAARNACCVVIMTEWDEFRKIDWAEMYEQMQTPLIVDMRGIVPVDEAVRIGFTVKGAGLPTARQDRITPMNEANQLLSASF